MGGMSIRMMSVPSCHLLFLILLTLVKSHGIMVEGTSANLSCLHVETPKTVKENQPAILTCRTSCNLTGPSFIWYKNGRPLTTKTIKNNQLHLQTVSSEDAGSYSCAVGGYDLRSADQTLRVTYPPKNVLVSISPPGEIVEGSSVTLTCSSDANPPVDEYHWFKETLLVGKGKDYTISNISSETAGEYKCKCVNAEGHKYSAGVTVNVVGPPKKVSVSISPSGNIVEGSSVTLTCSSEGNPPVKNYTWFKEGGASPVASGHSYSITNITAEHTGLYYCEARNELGRQMASAALSLYPEHSSTAVLVTVGLVCGAAVIIVCLVYLMIRRAKRRGQNVPPAAEELDSPDCGSKWSDAFQALPIAALSKPHEGNNAAENMYAAAEDVHVDLNATCLSFDDTCNALDETYVLPVNEPHDGDPLYANVSTNPADGAHMAHDEDGSNEYSNVGLNRTTGFNLD